jgi:hypothetical protein
MSLVQLIYMSWAIAHDDATTESILESSRRNNIANGITGMLLICDRSIVQVLEGSQLAVEETFDRIRLDRRHTGIYKFSELLIMDRNFSAWSMGYRRLDRGNLASKDILDSLFKMDPIEITSRVNPGVARTILRTFGNDLRM